MRGVPVEYDGNGRHPHLLHVEGFGGAKAGVASGATLGVSIGDVEGSRDPMFGRRVSNLTVSRVIVVPKGRDGPAGAHHLSLNFVDKVPPRQFCSSWNSLRMTSGGLGAPSAPDRP